MKYKKKNSICFCVIIKSYLNYINILIMDIKNIIITCVIGAVSGWIASLIMNSKGGLIRNIIMGIVGGFVGSWALGL